MSETCKWHKRGTFTSCNWCGIQICDDCVRAANGKKYCLECSKKLKPLKTSGLKEIKKVPIEDILKVF